MAKKSGRPKRKSEDMLGGGQEGHGFAESVSKAEAVRRAVAAGVESPAEGAAYVQEHFGIDMDNKTFSLNRSQQKIRDAKKQAAAKGKPGRKPIQAVEGDMASPPKQGMAGGESELLAAMEAMKPLVDSMGKEQVKRIVDLLG